ncbi:hypothetical protein BCV72DRAFT_237994 [Rhizopus microsporus var. microsporus]|uniref:Uncharacterized protein n=2 Tax=Rhizopus microsporus TaxID=58291 RepID=A0A2G4STL9_RHIZD|nr:uncharacterized protein RHIMIDRAFT_251895 [Rhizopus microsporus ATCC 52813]ORE11604.1 hypothetical protein BCV72DRAFT_237994 [Rhizopus microsporus var. microsporus]PHZ12101.1 hypothetical protein RHIMIDRAFT_251895 [Rhizopus microsporus ATCC 52813]
MTSANGFNSPVSELQVTDIAHYKKGIESHVVKYSVEWTIKKAMINTTDLESYAVGEVCMSIITLEASDMLWPCKEACKIKEVVDSHDHVLELKSRTQAGVQVYYDLIPSPKVYYPFLFLQCVGVLAAVYTKIFNFSKSYKHRENREYMYFNFLS